MATADDLEQHFHGCGSINRVTILCNRYSGRPKGYETTFLCLSDFIFTHFGKKILAQTRFAYIEFADKDSVQAAMALDESLFKGRLIKVNPKRTNRPGISSTDRGRGRGRGFGRIAFSGRGRRRPARFDSHRGASWSVSYFFVFCYYLNSLSLINAFLRILFKQEIRRDRTISILTVKV